MSCQNYLIGGLGATIAFAALLQTPTLAQQLFVETREPTEINQLSTPQKLIIPTIGQTEISPAVVTQSVTNSQDLLVPPQFSAVVSREMPKLWQMRVPIDKVGSLYATYEIRSENGKNNAVSNQIVSSSTVPVILQPLPIIEISRDLNSNTALVQGGVRLTMDLSSAQFAGGYAGDITVIVNQR